MKRGKRPVLAPLLASALMFAGMAPATASAERLIDDEPSEMATIGDALFARPVLLLATGVGLTIYTATLPFSILGGNEQQAAETLVLGPADATFQRCLGCTPEQERRRRTRVRTEKANQALEQQRQQEAQQQQEATSESQSQDQE